MNKIIYLYYLNTIIFCFPLWRQFMIIARSPDDDPNLWTKVGFFVFTLALVAGMWLCYFRIREAAWFFFLVAALIAVWVYFKPQTK